MPDARRQTPDAPRRGQVILLVLFAVVALLVAALWLADVHHAVLAKDRTQNAGDAAALAAARWQATALDLEGELNLFHALALASLDHAAVEAVTNAQLRLLFAGPLAGVASAQQAAMLNGAPSNPDFVEFVRDCARTARRGYGARLGDGSAAMPEPWPGAWEDYADALEAIAEGGVAAGVDNAAFLTDPAGAHWLLDPAFYDAVLGRDWCWFLRRAPGLLEDYSGWRWWPALPEADENPAPGSELLGLRLRPVPLPLGGMLAAAGVAEAFGGVSAEAPRPGPGTNELVATWMGWDAGAWGAWDAMKDPAMPLEGELREEYDYAGADAAMRVENPFARLGDTGGDGAAAGPMLWIGAAKPFGCLEIEGRRAPPTVSPVVLPVFRDVRLIPLDASSAPAGGSFDLRWRRHRTDHLPRYLERGVSALEPGCSWCAALARWEIPAFRQSGERWLATNSWKCTVSPPGGSPGGGSRHAH